MLAVRPYGYAPAPMVVSQPEPPKPSLWDWYRQLNAPPPEVPSPVQSAVTGLRHNAEGMAIGALLGFLDAECGGLDIRGKYPVDGIAAGILYALSIRDASKPDGFASDLRALSQSCSTVMLYRKTKAWRESKKAIPQEQTGKAIPKNIDPIVAAGMAAGLNL
jgi:hypothetical protein